MMLFHFSQVSTVSSAVVVVSRRNVKKTKFGTTSIAFRIHNVPVMNTQTSTNSWLYAISLYLFVVVDES